MDVDAGKKDEDAAREGEPNIAATSEAASSSDKPADDKTEIVDLTQTEKKVEVDKPVGKPAEKKDAQEREAEGP